MTRLTAVTAALAVALLGSLAVLWAAPAAAHTTEQPYLYAFVGPNGIDGRVELAIDDVATVLDIDLGADDQEAELALRAAGDRIRSYLADHLTFGGADRDWPIELGRIDLFRDGPDALAFVVVQYDVDVGAAFADEGPPDELDVGFSPFFDEIDGRDGLLLLTGGYTAGMYDPDKEIIVGFDAGSREQAVDLGGRGWTGNLASSVALGIDHIETGPDHILFVLALLLPSVLVFTDRWTPVAGFGAGLWRVLKIATFFTIAHSITFTLAGMGWLPTPPAVLVETVIAASIAVAALHNLRPILPNREPLLAFLFGLFHGMGFASLVADLDVSRSSQLLSLLGRNIGIEIGQIVVIVVLFPGLYLLRRTPFYLPLLTAGSLMLAALATLWSVERIAGIDLGTDGIVGGAISTPTAYWIAAAFTTAAAAAWWWARTSDRLAPAMP